MADEIYAIGTENLSKTFSGDRGIVHALDHITLHIEPGQIYGLLGPNGAGKSTFINILSTILLPTSGNASVLGYDILKQTRQVQENIGLCFGKTNFSYNLSPREILTYYGKLFNIDNHILQKKIDTLFNDLNITSFENSRFSQLSTGMKQKVAIAKAVLNDPGLIFLDEPTNGLDVDVANDVRHYLQQLVREKDKTILLTSHHLFEVEELCKTITVIVKGKVEIEGSVNEIRKKLGFSDTIKLVLDKEYSESLLSQLPGVISTSIDKNNISIKTKNAFNTVQAISDLVHNNSLAVLDMQVRKTSLEEMFTSIVRGEGNE